MLLAVRLSSRDAIIPPDKLRDYLLSVALEVFAANGQTVAVVSVPAFAVREATEHEVLSVRALARA